MVGWEYKGASETLLVPRRWYPKGKLYTPPFCHIAVGTPGPYPWKRKDQTMMDTGLIPKDDRMRGIYRLNPI